ncbi:MAG: MerR family DNA-binding protein [Pollutimonas bauzanensis]
MNIGQAAAASGVTGSGYRQYSEAEVQTLRFIKRSRDLGFSLGRIKTLIGLWQDTSRKSGDVKKLARLHIAELNEDISKLQTIRDQLEHLADCCHGDNRPDCPILADLSRPGR